MPRRQTGHQGPGPLEEQPGASRIEFWLLGSLVCDPGVLWDFLTALSLLPLESGVFSSIHVKEVR